jgi:antitoxin component of RelBE/YafQ-DinJ toxin-antitoxin module
MTKKMYSFRFDENLIDSAKKIAKKMGVSLSFFISYLIKEKIENTGPGKGRINLFNSGDDTARILNKIASEIKGLRVDINKSLKK